MKPWNALRCEESAAFSKFSGGGPPEPSRRLASSELRGGRHNLSHSKKFHSPLKILDPATGPHHRTKIPNTEENSITHIMNSCSLMSRSTQPPSGGLRWSRLAVTGVMFQYMLQQERINLVRIKDDSPSDLRGLVTRKNLDTGWQE